MKKLFSLFLLVFIFSDCAFADSYASIYEDLPSADFKLLKNIDPYQEKDYSDYAVAPYPLFRLIRILFYKGGAIQPGYYLLVPRTMKGNEYIFFKENGIVKHVIPVYKTELVPPEFYDNAIPQPLKTKRQVLCDKTKEKFYNIFKNSKQQSAPKAFIESNIVENNYNELILYFGDKKYYTLFKLEK